MSMVARIGYRVVCLDAGWPKQLACPGRPVQIPNMSRQWFARYSLPISTGFWGGSARRRPPFFQQESAGASCAPERPFPRFWANSMDCHRDDAQDRRGVTDLRRTF
jgi:hypothetical protein